MGTRPAHIRAVRSQGVLQIEWEDGHLSEYPLAGLRAACPCAECRGGHEGMGGPGSPEMLAVPLRPGVSYTLEAIEAVGSYAILPVWGDGHRYGIYSWDYLLELCPCGTHGRPEGAP